MPAAIIINGGTPGQSVSNLSLGVPVTLSNSTVESTYFWEFLSKPPGSSATLSTPTAKDSGFTPDIVGSYLIRITVNGTDESVVVAAVKTTFLSFRIPASGEEDQFNNNPLSGVDGWHEAVYLAFTSIDTDASISLKTDGSNSPTANISWNSKRITNLLDPSSAQDAATKNYVDLNPATHGLGSATHTSATIAQLNALISDGDFATVASLTSHTTDTVNPHATDIGNLGSGTLAELNAAITNATLFDTSLLDSYATLPLTILDGYALAIDLVSHTSSSSNPHLVTMDQTYEADSLIIADSGAIVIDAYGGEALELDGYLTFNEIIDPSPLSNRGIIYSKEISGLTELFYSDDLGNVTQITAVGAVNAAGGGGGSDGYNVKVSSDDTTPGFLTEKIVPGLNITVSELFSGSDEAFEIATDVAIRLPEQPGDPPASPDDGYLFTKDVFGTTELFYMDNYGAVTQITSSGEFNLLDGYISFTEDELDPAITDGTETTLTLSYEPAEIASLSVYRNGILMREVTSLSDSYQEYTKSGTLLTFLASSSPGDWLDARYMDSYSVIRRV